MPFTRQDPPFVNRVDDPNGPRINATWHNKVDKGVGDAHDELANHAGDTTNPHGVTATQANAAASNDTRLSDARTPTDASVTPAKMAAANKGVVICTSTTRPASPVEGQHIYETDTDATLKNTGTPAAPVWTTIGGGHEIQDDGTALPQQPSLDFQGPEFEVSDDSVGGKTIVKIGTTYVDVRKYGARPTKTAAENGAAFRAAADSLPARNGVFFVPPGVFAVDGVVGFGTSNLKIEQHGATISQSGTGQITYDLNKNALPDESVILNNINVHGGNMTNPPASYPGNGNVGIRARGITRCVISEVYGTYFDGQAFLEIPAVDDITVRQCRGYLNKRHIFVPYYQTNSAGNPQSVHIDGGGWSIFGTEGFRFDSIANMVVIDGGGYLIGSNAISIGVGKFVGTNSRMVKIADWQFEQGVSGGYYIKTTTDTTNIIRKMVLDSLTFETVDTNIAVIRAVRGFTMRDCLAIQNGTAAINLAADVTQARFRDCTRVDGSAFSGIVGGAATDVQHS